MPKHSQFPIIKPSAVAVGAASWRVDAGHGFAFPALDLAIGKLVLTTPGQAIGIATVCRSHHAGQAGYHVERLAEQGLVGLFFGNIPGSCGEMSKIAVLIGAVLLIVTGVGSWRTMVGGSPSGLPPISLFR